MSNYRYFNYLKNIRRLFDFVYNKKNIKLNKNFLITSKNKSKYFKDYNYKKTKKVSNRFLKNTNKFVFNSTERLKTVNVIHFLKKNTKGLSYFNIINTIKKKHESNNNVCNHDYSFKSDNTKKFYTNYNNLITLRI